MMASSLSAISRVLGVLLVLATVMMSTAHAAVENFPDRPITLVEPSPPGGTTDITARIFASFGTKYLGQPVEIVNIVGGAGGSVGTAKVAAARPDGYMLLDAADDSITIVPNEQRLPYSYKDFIPIVQITTTPFIVVAGPHAPIRSVEALKSYVQGHPNQLTVGTNVIGGITHMAALRVLKALGSTEIRFIPFGGGGPIVAALLGSSVDLGLLSPALALGPIQAGKLYPLFVTSRDPFEQLPNVPGTKALGAPDAALAQWYDVFAPARTPSDVVEKLNTGFGKILADPTFRAKLLAVGIVEQPNTSIADLTQQIATGNESMRALIKEVLHK